MQYETSKMVINKCSSIEVNFAVNWVRFKVIMMTMMHLIIKWMMEQTN